MQYARTIIAGMMLAAMTAGAQSVIRSLPWEVDTVHPAKQEWALIFGETADLECRYTAGVSNLNVTGATVILHCRTNGMSDGVSYQITGRVGRVDYPLSSFAGWVNVRVRPDIQLPHDVQRLSFSLETSLGGARNLVAQGTLRLSGDPTGTSPVSIPVWSYDEKGSALAVSNSLSQAIASGLGNISDRLSLAARASSNYVSDAVRDLASTGSVAAVESKIIELTGRIDTNVTTTVWGSDGSWSVYSGARQTRYWIDRTYTFHANGASIYGTAAEWDTMGCPADYDAGQYIWRTSVSGDKLTLSVPNYNDDGWSATYEGSSPVMLIAGNDPFGDLGGSPYVEVSVSTNSETYALVSDPATRGDVSNAVNAVVSEYFLSPDAWMTVDWTNQTIAVSLVSTNGTTNTVSVGSAVSIDPGSTNLLWYALRAGLAAKAPLAWGLYAPDGSVNPAPDYQLWLNSPATVFASGMSWSTYGSYAVVTATGMVVSATGSNGYFRISADTTNYLGVVQGGSVIVGAVSGSIRAHNGGAPDGWVEITYYYAGGDYPTIEFSPTLGSLASWTSVANAEWTDNLNGTATVILPASSSSGFWRGMTSSSYSYMLESTMPFNPRGGVIGSSSNAPVIFNSVTTVMGVDGHTYRIPAERTN
jgi:hypothetical protein